MSQTSPDPVTTAEAFLARLGAHGVDYLFGNAGTDFFIHYRGVLQGPGKQSPRTNAYRRSTREPGRRHGAWLLPRDRPAPGSDAARQRGHRERYLRPLQRVPR